MKLVFSLSNDLIIIISRHTTTQTHKEKLHAYVLFTDRVVGSTSLLSSEHSYHYCAPFDFEIVRHSEMIENGFSSASLESG